MIAIMPQMRLLVAVEPVDFRRGIDGLVAVCRQKLQADPMSGALFIFGSRNRKSIKILAYDGQGFYCFRSGFRAGVSVGGRRRVRKRLWGSMPGNCSCCCGMAIPRR